MWISQKRRGWVGGVAALTLALLVTTPSASASAALRSRQNLYARFRAVATFPPRDLTAPRISGIATVGQTLRVTEGSWTNKPSEYAYQWWRCDVLGHGCEAISGATYSTYVPGPADAGRAVLVVVEAENDGGSTTAESLPSAVISAVPANVSAPSISGTAQQGQLLSATPGAWAAFPTPSFAYQWLRCAVSGSECTAIAGGSTSSTYTTVALDAGSRLRVTVTATNALGSGTSTSGSTSVVGAPPANTSLPTITGTAQQGQTLTASAGTWTGYPTPSYSYAWERCSTAGTECSPIAGAGVNIRVVATGDVGRTLRATVTATNSLGSATATSSQTIVVLPAKPVSTSAPVVSGTPRQGRALTSTSGNWIAEGATFVYGWERCSKAGTECAAIGGAGSSSYLLIEADVGHTVRSMVTATNAGGATTASSAATAAVEP